MTHRTLTTEAEIDAYMHRSRMEMLAALKDGPATLSQIAARMGVHPANLTRHLRILEAAGLAVLVRKTDAGGRLEKWYAASATSFDVAPEADGLLAPHKTALAFARSDLSAALARLPDDEERTVSVRLLSAALTPARMAALEHEFGKLAEELEKQPEGAKTEHYRVMLALYPADTVDGADPERPVRLKAARRKK